MEIVHERVVGFECQMQPTENKYNLKPEEYEVYETVDRFNKEMITYMNQPEVEVENAIPSATQELGHSYYLQKKRLFKRRMRIHYAKFIHGQNLGSDQYDFFDAHNQTVCWERQNMLYDIRYVRNGRMIGKDDYSRVYKHYVFRAKNAQGLYTCPSCGAVQPLEVLLDGCDYCKAQFDINAYKNYVSSVCYDRATKYSGKEKRKKDMKSVCTYYFFVALLMSVGGVIGLLLTEPLSEELSILENLLLYGGSALSLFLLLFGFGVFWTWMNNRDIKKFDTIYDAIRNCNPDFDMDVFVSNMDSKIKAAFYATDKSDISAFVLCEADEFIKANQNVISCSVGQIELLNFRTDEMYQYVDVYRSVSLMRDMGNQIVPENKFLYLTLCKKRNYKMRSDVTLYRCPNCGASVSLKTGGVCGYCGSKIDYMLYDWAITEMNEGKKKLVVFDERKDGKLI